MSQFESAGNRRPGLRICLVLMFTLATGAAQANLDADIYEMLVISDQAFGEALMAGELEAAIEGIKAKTLRRNEIFAAQNNLCVAYVRADQPRKAKVACESAVKRSRYESRHNKAIALSNLGVVRALTGNTEGAMHCFRAAIRLTRELTVPAENLERLTEMLNESMAAQ